MRSACIRVQSQTAEDRREDARSSVLAEERALWRDDENMQHETLRLKSTGRGAHVGVDGAHAEIHVAESATRRAAGVAKEWKSPRHFRSRPPDKTRAIQGWRDARSEELPLLHCRCVPQSRGSSSAGLPTCHGKHGATDCLCLPRANHDRCRDPCWYRSQIEALSPYLQVVLTFTSCRADFYAPQSRCRTATA